MSYFVTHVGIEPKGKNSLTSLMVGSTNAKTANQQVTIGDVNRMKKDTMWKNKTEVFEKIKINLANEQKQAERTQFLKGTLISFVVFIASLGLAWWLL